MAIVPTLPERHLAGRGALVVADGDNSARERVAVRLRADRAPSAADVFPVPIHTSASVSRFAKLGAGTVVLQGAVVGSAAQIGSSCILNPRSSVDHDG